MSVGCLSTTDICRQIMPDHRDTPRTTINPTTSTNYFCKPPSHRTLTTLPIPPCFKPQILSRNARKSMVPTDGIHLSCVLSVFCIGRKVRRPTLRCQDESLISLVQWLRYNVEIHMGDALPGANEECRSTCSRVLIHRKDV